MKFMQMQQFKGKVVWITGASSGIGESLVKELAGLGSKVILSARRIEELERVAREAGLTEADSLIIPMDMEDYENFESKVNLAIKKFDHVDYLFNNAGVSSRALAMETPVKIDKKIMDINYLGNIALAKALLPHMVSRRSGHIIITSSVNGKLGVPMRSAIAAPKHALHGFYNTLREELWEYNIKITIIIPGYINTNVSVNALTASGEKFNKMSKYMTEGMDPRILARKILKAVIKGKREAKFGGSEILGIYLNKFFPALLSRKLRKMQADNTLDA
jgi:short-subunit dehydrogenase